MKEIKKHMKKNIFNMFKIFKQTETTLLAVVCSIFGHRYKVTKRITKSIAELQCKRCRKEFGINTSCESLLPLDKELKELHKSFPNYS